MLSISLVYALLGGLLLLVAVFTFMDQSNPKRWSSGLFWLLYGMVFLIGDFLPSALVGVIVIGLALIAGFGGLGQGFAQIDESKLLGSLQRIGKKIFVPALCIPLGTLFGVLILAKIQGDGWQLIEAKNVTLVSLAIAVLFALAFACWLTRETPLQGVREAKRLLEAMGWAVLLPQLLATLGFLFNDAGVGQAVATLSKDYLSLDSKFAAVTAYALAMAIFTIVMGNAFAAFPVITAGIGVPLLVLEFEGDPAVVAAIGMFCGYCGTLLTPMAANFNLVPAALLNLQDQHAVIKAQAPTALILLMCNIFLLYYLAF